jgi:hypothetical protein
MTWSHRRFHCAEIFFVMEGILWPLFAVCTFSFAALAQDLSSEPLFVIHEGPKWGYMDRTGRVVIPLSFSGAEDFSEGLASVSIGKESVQKEGYIDRSGRLVIRARYYHAGDFSEGLAPVAFKTRHTRPCVDCTNYDWRMKWGFIDKTGRLIIKPNFRDARLFHEGLAAVQDDSGKWGFIDHSGKLVIPCTLEYVTYFFEGLAAVKQGEAWGYIDISGKWQVEPRFTSAQRFREGVALARTGGSVEEKVCGLPCPPPRGGNWALIGKDGQPLAQLNAYAIIGSLSEDLIPYFSDPDNCGYMDSRGYTVIVPETRICSDFSEGLARIDYDGSGNPHYIDHQGRTVFATPFDRAEDFRNGLARVGEWWDDDKPWGYIDHSGKLVWSTPGIPAKR